MKRLHISSRAYADVVSARLYIAEHNPPAATRFWKKMRAQWRMLRRFPEMGRLRAEHAPGLHSFVVEPYVVLYQVTDDAVEIVRVLHGAQDIDAELQRDREEVDE